MYIDSLSGLFVNWPLWSVVYGFVCTVATKHSVKVACDCSMSVVWLHVLEEGNTYTTFCRLLPLHSALTMWLDSSQLFLYYSA
jgi:hypothetical protein